MTTISGDITVRILGLGSGATSYEYCLYGSSTSTRFPVLVEPPRIPAASIDVLSPTAASSSVSFRLLYEGGTSTARAAVRELLAVDSEPLASGTGGIIRTTRTVSYTETTVPVSDTSGISDGDYIAIGSEVMLVDGAPGASSITVQRAQRGTFARTLPSYAGEGVPVYSDPPSAIGLGVEIERDGDLLWRGFVASVDERDATTVTVSCRSLMQALREREYQTPTALGYERGGDYNVAAALYAGVALVPDQQPTFLVDTALFGNGAASSDFQWQAARIYDDQDRFVCVPVAYRGVVERYVEGDSGAFFTKVYNLYEVDLEDGMLDVYQVGEGDQLLTFPEGEIARLVRVAQVLARGTKVEYYDRVTGGANLPDILDHLLGQTAIPNLSLGLPSAWYNTALVARDGFAPFLPALQNEQHDVSNTHGVPRHEGRLLSLIEDYYLAPLFCGLAESSGVLRALDWSPGETSIDHAITSSDVRAGHTYARRASDAVPYLVYDFQVGSYRNDLRAVRLSDLGVRQPRNTIEALTGYAIVAESIQRDIEVIASAWASVDAISSGSISLGVPYVTRSRQAIYLQRGRDIVDLYGRPLPSLGITCLATSNVTSIDVGDVVSVTLPDVPAPDGSRGISAARGLVYAMAIDTRDASVSLSLLMIDAFRSVLDLGRYAPSGEVASWDNGTSALVIQPNAFTASTVAYGLPDRDIEGFELAFDANGGTVLDVVLYDADGDEIEAGDVTAVDTATNTLTVSWKSAVTPSAGDIVAVSDSADNTTLRSAQVSSTLSERFAFFGDDADGHDAGGNDVPRYAE